MNEFMNTVADRERQRWERETLDPTLKKSPERATVFGRLMWK